MPLGGCSDSSGEGIAPSSSSSGASLAERERSTSSASRNSAHRAKDRLAETDGGQQRARGHQDAQRRQALQTLRREDRHGRHGQGRQATIDQPLTTEKCRGAGLAGKQQRPQAQDGVQPDLGHDREQGGDRRAGR
ncbi:hypothetical protein WR25_22882 [Diploscapter pachys]|uniref:Uncharacterized protein n=1 Tax=Diploscapter pachys TaxID=2018661 RepID=A0A2A2M5C1_9BILA|nr:hypothetical protein WR25_22882 [Diploscapter pachys]